MSSQTRGAGAGQRALTVYFDGACPVCAREIAAYRRQRGAEAVHWVDASQCAPEQLGAGLDRRAALARLHVRASDGALISGAAAFAALWERLPALAWLGRVARHPWVLPVLERGYSGFLRARRLWRRAEGPWPAGVLGDLRTDHAGETGAVAIYRGMLAASRDRSLRRFALRHLATEKRHLRMIETVLPRAHRSRLLPLWRLSGWLLGAAPSLFGPRASYATIEAVETFVDRHYAAQLARLDALDPQKRDAGLQSLGALLDACRRDEVSHRDEAAARVPPPRGLALRAWARVIGAGSAIAVAISRRL